MSSPDYFGKYYQGAWDSDQNGVGMEFTGKPTDAHAFLDVMLEAGCNPVASRRILEEILVTGTRKVTVMRRLQFIQIGDALARIGVTMKIIPPCDKAAAATSEHSIIDSAVLHLIRGKEVDVNSYAKSAIQDKEWHNRNPANSKSYGQKIIDEIRRRFNEAQKSFTQYEHHDGGFAIKS